MKRISLPGRRESRQARELVLDHPVPFDRSTNLDRLAAESFDVVVVGGGITGAYTALDCALRGLRVALVEKDDFASGTSSKSSKMVHGGLRYIEQGNLPLVRHSLLERQRLRDNAPHLVQRLPFMFPVLARGGALDPRLASGFEALLWSYDAAGGWREGRLHQRLSRNEVLARCPTLRAEELRYGLLYFDARTDDARLTLTVARTAALHGACVVNHARLSEVRRSGGRISGVEVQAEDRTITVPTRCVVMATGVWLRDFSAAGPHAEVPPIRPAKGVHVVLPWRLIRNDCTVTVPVPGRTRRATITRWGDYSVLGTTDEDYQGDLDSVHCTSEERDFLLEGANSALRVDLKPEDITGSIAGCRPLIAPPGGKTLEVSRNHEIRTDPDGLVTVVGGKLTTSRHMAEQTVDAVSAVLDRRTRCRTQKAPLVGGVGFDPQASQATGGLAAHLGERYGTESHFVSELLTEPGADDPLVAGLPYIRAEAVHAVRHEMARTIDDVLSRRTRARLYRRDASAEAAGAVAAILGGELGLDQAALEAQLAAYRNSTELERNILMGVHE
ncbi:glycerol-3-phosphate dehydrogenase/oxidase [Enemella evansiae]|uniref:glycerol-3-phosphate dehydrogenase/oxidase n=1 Tax=Enemella evansiae TaxID=2016499 RepID=UPI000B97BF25|nr:glycerol-3-phosphate dehydrogenase/oxidase [Enemella evansiae]OYO03965.1 FAD-dependent oxidoreductase [Enemella evansiae]